MIDVTKAMLDPSVVFQEPKDVAASNELTRNQKIEISRRGEYDAREPETTEDEAGRAPSPVRQPRLARTSAFHAQAAFRERIAE